MKAIRAVIIGEQELRWEEFRLPNKPKAAQVLVRIERTIISAGTELANYTGLDPDTRKKGSWCCYPWNPGYGGIGTVLAVGPDVDEEDLEVGDRVYGIFHHGTHALVDTTKRLCVKVPKALDATTAAFVRMGNVAISAYRRSTVSLGDAVVIIGLGLVGNLAGQFYRAAGLRVIGMDLSAQRRKLALECGFHHAMDPGRLTAKTLATRIADLNNDKRPRVVVDAVGESRLIELALKLVAPGGHVVLLGTPRAPYETNATPMLDMCHRRQIDIRGALEWGVPLLKRRASGPSTESAAETILQMLVDGSLKVAPLLSHVLPPAELNDAYQGLLHRKNDYVGVVLDWENIPAPAPNWTDKKPTAEVEERAETHEPETPGEVETPEAAHAIPA
jgi:2-desacetyl-2-hydroxyethyl bacteriochlorophyllide A dehydrogenase